MFYGCLDTSEISNVYCILLTTSLQRLTCLRALTAPGSIPSSHMGGGLTLTPVLDRGGEWGFQCPLLASLGTSHTWCTDLSYMKVKQLQT